MSEVPPSPEKHRRRPRYRGTHPRHFHEKYKELQPERYAAEIEKVLASGKTPAGTHRPILVREIMEVLKPQAGHLAVDCTLGHGGHTMELLSAVQPGGHVLALDVDPIELPRTEARLRERGFGPETLTVNRQNFAGLAQLLAKEAPAGADVILADLGLSSMQMDDPARGFTFKREGPLDLRMNPNRGRSASAWLGDMDERELSAVLSGNADEPRADLLAQALVLAHRTKPVLSTTALARVIRDAMAGLPGSRARNEIDTTIRRVFQAMRIAVNDEFSALETLLRNLPGCLKPGGRVAILTFHSGEDRRVKKFFQNGLRDGVYERIAEDVIRAGPEELHSNPRASSAKLRWAVKAARIAEE